MIEDGAKHTLTLYNCKVSQTGEVGYQGANAKCSANLKVKGEFLPHLVNTSTAFYFWAKCYANVFACKLQSFQLPLLSR